MNSMDSPCWLTLLAHLLLQMLLMLPKWNNNLLIKSRLVWTKELIRKCVAITTPTAIRKTQLLEAMARVRQGKLTKFQMPEQDQ